MPKGIHEAPATQGSRVHAIFAFSCGAFQNLAFHHGFYGFSGERTRWRRCDDRGSLNRTGHVFALSLLGSCDAVRDFSTRLSRHPFHDDGKSCSFSFSFLFFSLSLADPNNSQATSFNQKTKNDCPDRCDRSCSLLAIGRACCFPK